MHCRHWSAKRITHRMTKVQRVQTTPVQSPATRRRPARLLAIKNYTREADCADHADSLHVLPNDTQPQIVGRRRRFARKGNGGQAIARRRSRTGKGRSDGKRRAERGVWIVRPCVCATTVIARRTAKEVNIVQYDWPAPRRQVFRFSLLSTVFEKRTKRHLFVGVFTRLRDFRVSLHFELVSRSLA